MLFALFLCQAKAAMRTEKPETAAGIFQSAVGFLSQEIPDPTCQASDSQTRDDERDMEEEMKALTERVYTLEKQFQKEKLEVQKNCSSLELKVSTSSDSMAIKILHLSRKFDSLKNDVQALDSEARQSLKELTEVSKENGKALKGLRKFQSLFKEKTQAAAAVAAAAAAAAVTPPPTVASAAAIAMPLTDVR
ncbi:hypothetical protein PoB_003337500 [Plakobranchus ocellatus]|uniref:Uncharacterized protein n=1 Tax=Plakobranchus ocellatus TaxID=259542 RepID=A0AAV4AJ75_9GAST|nr:hypothetical protein PoB_003337500 [Plakobranchus ocellatus]